MSKKTQVIRSFKYEIEFTHPKQGGGTIIDRFFKIGKSVTFAQIDHFRFGVCWCPKIRIDGNIVRYQKAKRTWGKGKDEDGVEEENMSKQQCKLLDKRECSVFAIVH